MCMWIADSCAGTDVAFERSRLANMNIIVCTPGRLLQHMDENSAFSCDQLQILIIDEADRILDLGFQQQVRLSLSHIHILNDWR